MKKNNTLLSKLIVYLPPLLVFGAALALGAAVLWPGWQGLTPLGPEISDLEKEVSNLSGSYDTARKLDGEKIDSLMKIADQALPEGKSFAGLLTGLEALSQEAGSRLVSFDSAPGLISSVSAQSKPAAAQAAQLKENLPAGLQYTEAQVGISSNVTGLISLVDKVAKSSRLVTLEKVAYTSSNLASAQSGATTSIIIRVYYQPTKKPDGSAVVLLMPEEEKTLLVIDSLSRFTVTPPDSLNPNPNPFVPGSREATSSSAPRI